MITTITMITMITKIQKNQVWPHIKPHMTKSENEAVFSNARTDKSTWKTIQSAPILFGMFLKIVWWIEMLTFSVRRFLRLIKVQDASGSLTAQYEFDKMSGGWNLETIYFA